MRGMQWVGRATMSSACLAMGLFTGCSLTGGALTLFPTSDPLLRSTKEVRSCMPIRAPLPRELQKTILPSYVVQPGDSLAIELGNTDSPLPFPAEQPILPDGSIDLGRFGRMIVAGRPVEQIEVEIQAIIDAIDQGKERATVNVRLINPQSAVYYVLGEVKSPGSFAINGRETVLDAIIAAGGLSGKASPCNVILSRPTVPDGCRIVLPICYRQITQLGDTSTNYQIMPGDRVYVASRTCCEVLLPCFARNDCPLCCKNQCACVGGCVATYQPPSAVPPVELSPPSGMPSGMPAGGESVMPGPSVRSVPNPQIRSEIINAPPVLNQPGRPQP
jgi:polysaccharide export outer membrane protein